MKVKIGDILPNPYRDLARYPLSKSKIKALRESIQDTGFWDNIVGRVNSDGKVEIAYGHHRIAAAMEAYGGDKEVTVIIKDLNERDMLLIMCQENREEWSADFISVLETLSGVVKAYASGNIELPDVTIKKVGSIRYAPSYISGNKVNGERYPYTTFMVATFLGWTSTTDNREIPNAKAFYGIRALELEEMGALDLSTLAGLSVTAAVTVIRALSKSMSRQEAFSKARKERLSRAKIRANVQRGKEKKKTEEEILKMEEEAAIFDEELHIRISAIAKGLTDSIKKGEISTGRVGIEAFKMEIDQEAPVTQSPDIAQFTQRLATEIRKILYDDLRSEKLDELVKHRGHIPTIYKEPLVSSLKALAERAITYAVNLEAGESREIKVRSAALKLLEVKDG